MINNDVFVDILLLNQMLKQLLIKYKAKTKKNFVRRKFILFLTAKNRSIVSVDSRPNHFVVSFGMKVEF